MSKISIVLFFILTIFHCYFSYSQKIEIKKLPKTINSEESEFNFFQTDEKTAYYTKSTLQEDGYQSSIYKTKLREGKWQKGKYFHVGENYSSGNIYFFDKMNNYCFTSCNQDQECIICFGEMGSPSISFFKTNNNWPSKRSGNKDGKNIFHQTHPVIAYHKDKKVLYFSSNREGGYGGMDIWLSVVDKDGDFGSPINLGEQVNTKHNEITPYYNINNKTLYFSSDRKIKERGFDIYFTEGKLNSWKESKVAEEFNTEQDEMYITFFNSKQGYFSSNRGDTTCCNNIYSFEYKEKKIDTIEENILKEPIYLYFHNDEPQFSEKLDTTEATYKEAYISYFQKKEEYITLSKIPQVETFFSEKLKYNFNKINLLLKDVLAQLNKGRVIEIKINGYSSPLHSNEYNILLSKRRVVSFLNFLYEYNSSSLKEYLINQKLKILVNSYGEEKSSQNISDDPKDKIKSIYSINAMLQRRIEIIEVSSKNF